MTVKLSVLDMAGTTVDDRIDRVPLVLKSYSDAFNHFGINVPMEVLNEQRGRDKYTVISELGGDKADEIYEHFHKNLLENINNIKEIQGTSQTFRELKNNDIKIVTSTGFPMDVADGIVSHLGWLEKNLIDGWVCSEMVGVSRPDPAMIKWSMKAFNIFDPSNVIKVDDTAKGIEEGQNAKVHTVAVLTGTQSIQRLSDANPDTIIKSITDLPDYLKKEGLV
jgi:phosphonoacetaldehyde hydrolase